MKEYKPQDRVFWFCR